MAESDGGAMCITISSEKSRTTEPIAVLIHIFMRDVWYPRRRLTSPTLGVAAAATRCTTFQRTINLVRRKRLNSPR